MLFNTINMLWLFEKTKQNKNNPDFSTASSLKRGGQGGKRGIYHIYILWCILIFE